MEVKPPPGDAWYSGETAVVRFRTGVSQARASQTWEGNCSNPYRKVLHTVSTSRTRMVARKFKMP